MPDPRLARVLVSWGVPRLAASSRAAETLAEAGLAGATAVVCVHEDDLYTLETALLTRQLREDVRVVAQLGNPAVGRALAQVGVSVLDVAGLSAPSVVEACLRSGGPGRSACRENVSRSLRTVAPKGGSLRELYGALAPIAVAPRRGRRRGGVPRPRPADRGGGRGNADRHAEGAARRGRPERARQQAGTAGFPAAVRPRGAPGTSGTWRCPCCTLPTGGSCWP